MDDLIVLIPKAKDAKKQITEKEDILYEKHQNEIARTIQEEMLSTFSKMEDYVTIPQNKLFGVPPAAICRHLEKIFDGLGYVMYPHKDINPQTKEIEKKLGIYIKEVDYE